MKIKTDFVTNSSSTCYVLSAIITAHLPCLSKGFGILNKFYPHQAFLYKDYAHIVIKVDPEDAYEQSKPLHDINLNMVNSTKYNQENDTDEKITYFELMIDLYNPYWNGMEIVVKEFLENLFFKQLKEKIPASQLMYFCFPSSIHGDGWDGGDPQGPEHSISYKHDLFKAKTNMGILTIMDSSIIPEVRSIEQPLNLNEILLDNINQQGLRLEEHNDKNS